MDGCDFFTRLHYLSPNVVSDSAFHNPHVASHQSQSPMTLKTFLCGLFCDSAVQKPFTTLRHRSGQHLRLVLQKQFPNAHVRIPDTDLSAPSLKDVETWLHKDLTSEKKYHAEWYDCEDFAREIRCKMFKIGQGYKTTITIAYCEGYNPKHYHGYNMLIDDHDRVFIIEPQDDHCVPAAESKYRTDFIQL